MDTHSGRDCAVRVSCMQSGGWVYYRNITNENQLIYGESLQRLNCSGGALYLVRCGINLFIAIRCSV